MEQSKEQKALNTLISAVQVATKRGAFELSETKLIAEAVDVFTKQPEEAPEVPPNAQNDDLSTTTGDKPVSIPKGKK